MPSATWICRSSAAIFADAVPSGLLWGFLQWDRPRFTLAGHSTAAKRAGSQRQTFLEELECCA